MTPRCHRCGRWMKRQRDLPTTAFPQDRPYTASSVPYAPFACFNPRHNKTFLGYGLVQYEPVGFATPSKTPQGRSEE